jgi:anti-sigma factor RsiW
VNTNPEPLTDDLDWQAFCYAAGELSPTAMAEFEQRLGSDQATREALARAIELTQAIASAESLASVVRRPAAVELDRSRRSMRQMAWGAMGTAALVAAALVAAVVLWTGGGNDPQPKTAEKLGRADRELAVAWSQTRSELAIASDADFWFPAHLNSSESLPNAARDEAHDDAARDEAHDDARDELLDDSLMGPTPAWLMAAVEGYSPADEDVDPAEPADRGQLTPFDNERTEN